MKKKWIKVALFAIIFYFAISAYNKVNAVDLAISLSKSNAEVGETINVTITSAYTGRVNLSCSSGGTLSESKVWLENNSQTIQLKANTEGKISITAQAEGGTLSNNGADVAVGTKGASVNFTKRNTTTTPNNNDTSNQEKPEATTIKSNNANLSDLGFTPNDFKGFKPNTTTYNATVSSDVGKITIYAKTQDKKSTVQGAGVQNLNTGKNAFNIIVTAEDGTQKTYTINVTREEGATSNTETTNQEEKEQENKNEENLNEENTEGENGATSSSDLQKLEIKGYKLSPSFSSDVYEYTLDINKDISDLEVITEGANHNVVIEIVGNTNLVEGENVITILVYNEETDKHSTYQITINKVSVDLDVVNTALTDATKKANTTIYIVLGVVIFIVFCIIIFIIVRYKYKNRYIDDMYEYDEEDSENMDLKERNDVLEKINTEEESNEINSSKGKDFFSTLNIPENDNLIKEVDKKTKDNKAKDFFSTLNIPEEDNSKKEDSGKISFNDISDFFSTLDITANDNFIKKDRNNINLNNENDFWNKVNITGENNVNEEKMEATKIESLGIGKINSTEEDILQVSTEKKKGKHF